MVDWAGFAQLRQQNQEQNNPLNKFAQGYQIGAAINAQRQQQQANEAKMKRQQEMEGDFTRIYENYSGNPAEQAKELGRLSFKYPEIADKLDKQAASLDEKVKQGLVNDILPAYNAILTGNKDVAMQQLRTRAEAYNNAGDKANYERFNNFANSLENSTDLSQQVMTGGMYLAGIMGTKDFMGAVEKIPKTAQEFANMPLEQRQTLAKTLQEEEKAKQEAFTTQGKPLELQIKQEEVIRAPIETQIKQDESTIKSAQAKYAPEKERLDVEQVRANIALTNQQRAKAVAEAKKVNKEIEGLAKAVATGAINIADPEKRFAFEKDLRSEYSKETKNHTETQNAFDRMEAIYGTYLKKDKDGTLKIPKGETKDAAVQRQAAADLGLIFNYMKMLDPGSTVREGEFATAANATSIPDQIKNMYNKVASGERLTANQRGAYFNQAKDLYKKSKGRADEVKKSLSVVVDNYGLNKDNVFSQPRIDYRSLK